jgi:hypothetical protein
MGDMTNAYRIFGQPEEKVSGYLYFYEDLDIGWRVVKLN